MNRVCPICYRTENARFNFGNNREAESEFHKQKWCNCGYTSGEEMMKDQDLGFTDKRWVGIAKYFLDNYFLRLGQGSISNKDENVRFFLKLLKSSANNYRLSLELKPRNEDEKWEFVYDGKPKKIPRKNIFDNSMELEHLPEKVVLDKLNKNILLKYQRSKQKIEELQKNHIRKNRIITGLVFILVVLGIIMIL
jgi:hypothetical protein